MASLQVERYGHFHITFRYNGRRYKRSLHTRDAEKADARLYAVNEVICLLETGVIDVPDGVNEPDFVLSGGKLRAKPQAGPHHQQHGAGLKLRAFLKRFFESIPDSNLEQSTLRTMRIHERHFIRIFGPGFSIGELTLPDLQRYVNARAKESTQFIKERANGKRKPIRTRVSAGTIKKELATLGTAWRWAASAQLVEGAFPRKGLRLPKSEESSPFQTWDEIDSQIERGDLEGAEADVLWDTLYLRRSEIDDLLQHVESTANYAFIYPLFVMAAHTGARRSEMMRSQRVDFDFHQDFVTIRERKRVRGTLTKRRVPLSPALKSAMQTWFENEHPGGPQTFCYERAAPRSRNCTTAGSPITRDQIHDHFKRTLKCDTRWSKIRGWHCFRHSFISNLACEGIDQRIIDEFVGHTTEQMRRRYRHLFPNVKKDAILSVFG